LKDEIPRKEGKWGKWFNPQKLGGEVTSMSKKKAKKEEKKA
jgi:hypothetical protein